jgi:mono/diheme cytochrome c family protein
MNLKITLAVAGVSAMALSCFAQGGPGGPGQGPGPGMGGGPAAPVDWSKLPPASDKKGVTYATDIKPLIDANCISCHGATRPSGGVRLDSLESILAGQQGRGGVTALVVPGKGAESVLVRAVSRLDRRTAMPQHRRARGPGGPGAGGTNAPAAETPAPPQPKDFTAEEVGLVRAWVDQGAK